MVAPSAKPPVAKIVDFSNFKYQIKKRDQTSKKKSKAGDTKELRMTPFIAENDLNTRIKKVKEFLADGDRVKINVKFVGRQITRKEFGHELVDRITTALTGAGSIDQPAKMMGKMLTVVYKPVPKNKKPNS